MAQSDSDKDLPDRGERSKSKSAEETKGNFSHGGHAEGQERIQEVKVQLVSDTQSSDTKQRKNVRPKALESKLNSDLEYIRNMIVKCSACGKQVNHHDSHRVKRHPHLKVLLCKDCAEFYGTGEFSQDEDGDKYCRWCAQGGHVFGCDFCTNVFCSDCIRRNFGRGEARKVKNSRWKCYVCDPSQLQEKVSFCDMIIDYSQNSGQNKKLGKKVKPKVVQNALDMLGSEVSKPFEWLPAAFDSALFMSSRFKRKIEKIRGHSTAGKSTKQIVRKLEQIIDCHKSDLKRIINKVNEKYSMYIQDKLSGSSIVVSLSDDDEVSFLDLKVMSGKKENEPVKQDPTAAVPNNFDSVHEGKPSTEQPATSTEYVETDISKPIEPLTNGKGYEKEQSECSLPDSESLISSVPRSSSPLIGKTHSDGEKNEDSRKSLNGETRGIELDISPIRKKPSTSDLSYSKESYATLNESSEVSKPTPDAENVPDSNTTAKNLLLQSSDSENSETSTLPNNSCDEALLNEAAKNNSASSSNSDSDATLSSLPGSDVGVSKNRCTVAPNAKESNSNYFLPEEIISRDEYSNDPKLRSKPVVLIEKLPEIISLRSSCGLKDEVTASTSTAEPKGDEDELTQLTKYVKNLSAGLPKRKRIHKNSSGDEPTGKAVKEKKAKTTRRSSQLRVSSASDSFSLSSDDDSKTIGKPPPLIPLKELDKDINQQSKDALLQDDSESSSTTEFSESSSVSKKSKAKGEKKKTKTECENYSPPTIVVSDDDDDDDFKSRPKKSDKLLKETLLTEEKSKSKKEKATPNGKKKGAKRKVIYSDESNGNQTASDVNSSESSDSDSSSRKKSRKPKQKRKRVKVADNSSSEENDKEDRNNSQGTPGKGRKNIRKVISDRKLTGSTREAQEAEKQRMERIAQRQKLYNKIVERDPEGKVQITRKMVLEVDKESKEEVVEIDPDIVEKLKPHQVEGVKFMWESTIESLKELNSDKPGSGCILAHCMGLGKTLQVIAYLHTVLTNKYVKKKLRTAMIICPYNTVLNWVAEFEKWLDGIFAINVFEMNCVKTSYDRRDHLKRWHDEGGVMIVGYNIFSRLAAGNISKTTKKLKLAIFEHLCDPGPDIVICDEGHMLKNDTSSLSKAANKIKTRRRIVLTGTPLQNNLREYHCMMNFVKPNLLGTGKEFTNRFVNPIVNGQYDDSSVYDVKLMKKRVHILHKLLEGCVQRCDYTALMKFLPPKHEFVINVQLSELQIKLYRHYLDNFARGKVSNGKVDGSKLFHDYNVLKNVWTYPWILYLAFYRAEKKKLFSDVYDEDSMGSFIDDDDNESSSENEVEAIDLDNPKPGPSKEANDSSGDEIIKTYTTRSRGAIADIDEVEPVESAAKKQWFSEIIPEEEKINFENSAKITLLLDILRECESIGDKVLVFSQSLLTLDMIESVLEHLDENAEEDVDSAEKNKVEDSCDRWVSGVDYFRMDGSTSVDLRSRWIELFNDTKNVRGRLFLISTKAGSLGTNLVGANRVVMMDASWNPSHDVQAIFRVYRFGQTKPVYIYRLIAQGTMEEKIYNRQVTKLSLSCRVVDEQQIDRHYNAAHLAELYTFEPEIETNRATPMVPNDRLLADMLIRHSKWIVKYHEHDSLLQSSKEDELTEEDRRAAWQEYENEKDGILNNHFQRGIPNISVGPSNLPFLDLKSIPDANMAFASLVRQIQAKSPNITEYQLWHSVLPKLADMKAFYQTRHAHVLHLKGQLISKAEVSLQDVNMFLAALVKNLEKVTTFMETVQMKISQLRHTQQFSNQQGVWSGNITRTYMKGGNQAMKENIYSAAGSSMNRGPTPRFVNIQTGHAGSKLPTGAKVYASLLTTNEKPTIIDITSDKETVHVSGTEPIVTEAEEAAQPEPEEILPTVSKSNGVEITEID